MDKMNVSLVSEDLGNTITKSSRKRSRRWAITLNNYEEEEYNSLMVNLSQLASGFIIGKEIGKDGTPHLQGYIEFKSQREFSTVKRLNNRMHIERAMGTKNENIRYCSKDGDFECNLKLDYEESPTIIDEVKLYEWQKWIVNIIKNEIPNSRDVIWIYDCNGNNGKSEICKFLHFHKLAEWIQGGKATDIKNMLLTNKECRDIVIDLSRSTEGYVSYTVMEELKNGYIYSGKYEGGKKLITTPHVIIMANFLPDTTKLSSDRWKVYELNNKMIKEWNDDCDC